MPPHAYMSTETERYFQLQ